MNEHANGDVMTDPTAPFDRAGIEQRQARRLGLRRFERGAIQLDLDEAEADLRAALQELDRLNEPIDLEVRLTSRLLNHLKAAIAHGVKHVNHDYPGSVNIERIGSVEKRVSGAVWSILRQHPDVRHRAGKFEDELRQQLITSEVECAKRSVMIGELRAEAGALRQERDSLQARIDVLEPPARSYNRTLARAEHAEQQLATLRAALEQCDGWRFVGRNPRTAEVHATVKRALTPPEDR